MEFSTLLGKTLTAITVNDKNDEITFVVDETEQYIMQHWQSCCELVKIEDIVGDLQDLIGTPILLAEESSYSPSHDEKHNNPSMLPKDVANALMIRKIKGEGYERESETWTFYKLASIRGYVDLRWYGTSNGYYSERVDFFLKGSDEDRSY